jgi:aryl-alcohol dehydrogenase-like predicted oxidoreductase
MNSLSRLGLGTAQFGMDYGVSNRQGAPDEDEIAAILARAVDAGIGYVDTAPSYGAAEVLIGRHLPAGHRLRIVTKTPPIADARIEARHGKFILDSLAASLERLKTESLYGLLVHQTGDLAKTGWQHIVEALQEAQARHWVEHIGASVYDANQLALVEDRFRPQIVQLPLNALDRRAIISGTLARLKAAGTEVHARSVFLQGLLLMKPNELPNFFAPVRQNIASLHRLWRERGLSAIDGCIAFALTRSEIDAVIVGVNHRHEYEQIEAAVVSYAAANIEFDVDQPIDSLFVDPSRWPAFNH